MFITRELLESFTHSNAPGEACLTYFMPYSHAEEVLFHGSCLRFLLGTTSVCCTLTLTFTTAMAWKKPFTPQTAS
jgi:hypothetical protein